MAEVTEEQHARAMLRGAWQCPACALGWMKYDIAGDLNLCPSCGYHGGEARAGPGAVEVVVSRADWDRGYPTRDVLAELSGLLTSIGSYSVKVRICLCPTPPPNTTI